MWSDAGYAESARPAGIIAMRAIDTDDEEEADADVCTYQGGANNRTTTRTRWVWRPPKEPHLHKKHVRMVLHGA